MNNNCLKIRLTHNNAYSIVFSHESQVYNIPLPANTPIIPRSRYEKSEESFYVSTVMRQEMFLGRRNVPDQT